MRVFQVKMNKLVMIALVVVAFMALSIDARRGRARRLGQRRSEGVAAGQLDEMLGRRVRRGRCGVRNCFTSVFVLVFELEHTFIKLLFHIHHVHSVEKVYHGGLSYEIS